MSRLYTIAGQRPIREVDAAQNVYDAYEITYAGPNGIIGRITIPVATASPENVDAIIRERLQAQLAISQLGE